MAVSWAKADPAGVVLWLEASLSVDLAASSFCAFPTHYILSLDMIPQYTFPPLSLVGLLHPTGMFSMGMLPEGPQLHCPLI